MSETPRTDAAMVPIERTRSWCPVAAISPFVDADFARQLERELTEARKALGEAVRRLNTVVRRLRYANHNHDADIIETEVLPVLETIIATGKTI